jgi:hypothetical protein
MSSIRKSHGLRFALPVLGCLALTALPKASAQTPPATILTVEMENVVQYQENFANLPKNGTSPNMEGPITSPATFFPITFIADIVAVNGKKSKGTTVARGFWVGLTPNPSVSPAPNPTGVQAIADVTRFLTLDTVLEIQQADGSSLGTLVLAGVAGGAAGVGAPKAGLMGNFVVTGGTGAFLGARGQGATSIQTGRATSAFENPINRRTFPGGIWKLVIQLIPLKTPEVASTASGPAIVHSIDYSLVTASNPARAGELLTLFASGLGPTRPGVEPGQPFTASPLQTVSSPVDVLVNGEAGEVLYSGGYPNTVDNYQVNFRLPGDIAPGLASVQIRAAWVPGTEVKIPVK